MMRRIVNDRGSGRRRAAILVLTLWIVVVLGLISASMLEEVYLELKVAKYHRDDLEAMALARAGLARAITDLRNDYWMDKGRQGQPFDSFGEVWARPGTDGREDDRMDVSLGRGKFSVWVDDETAKLPLNMVAFGATPRVAGGSRVPGSNPQILLTVLYELGLQEKEAQEVASAIRDYVDPDDVAQPPGTGKEDEYYSSVAADKRNEKWDPDEDAPIYRCKNALFSSVDELLSVHGVTPELFYGVDPEDEMPLSPIEQLKARAEEKRTRGRRKRTIGLRDVFSVHSPGTINLNTADEFTLRVLIRTMVGSEEQASSMAEKIVEARRIKGHGTFNKDNVIRTVQELSKVTGLPPQLSAGLRRVAALDVRSDMFRIYALGEVGPTQHLICAVVTRRFEQKQPGRMAALIDHGVVHERLAERFRRRHGEMNDPIQQITVRVIQWYDL